MVWSIGTFNQNIQIMDVQSHNHIRTLTGHIGTVTCLCTTPCGQFMFSASVDTTVQVRMTCMASAYLLLVLLSIGMEPGEDVTNSDTSETWEGDICISFVVWHAIFWIRRYGNKGNLIGYICYCYLFIYSFTVIQTFSTVDHFNLPVGFIFLTFKCLLDCLNIRFVYGLLAGVHGAIRYDRSWVTGWGQVIDV